MGIRSIATAAKPEKDDRFHGAVRHPNGGLNKDFGVRRCIEETVYEYVADKEFGDEFTENGKLNGRWTIDIARLVELLKGQIKRKEILQALDQLVAEDRVMLWYGDGGISAEPLQVPNRVMKFSNLPVQEVKIDHCSDSNLPRVTTRNCHPGIFSAPC